MNFYAKHVSWIFVTFLFFFQNLNQANAEEACKLFYNGYPEELMDKEITVPDNTVALSEFIKVGSPSVIPEIPPDGVSIFFIIDHSSSMQREEKDMPANRFSVLYDLVDSIHQRMPLSEVGLAIFRQDLVFSDGDSPYFVKAPNWKVNSYLKLMELDKTYDNNQTGADVLRKYLESKIDKNGVGDMVYKHSLPLIPLKTNINVGFAAAKHALESSQWPKHKRFIIFISDGEANQPDSRTKNDYVKGTDVPTTFTIYFSRDEKVPQSIQLMTENIQNNGYSGSNRISRYWGYDNSGNVALTRDKLKNFLMDNILSVIFKSIEAKPRNLTVNGVKSDTRWGDSLGFKFDALFPLKGSKTDFKQIIDYNVVTDSVAPDGQLKQYEKDSLVSVDFSVKIENHAQPDSNFLFECWDRKFQFFHNDNPVNVADETMGELEIRFIEDKIDVVYGYENVSVDINNTETQKNDLEKFKMEDKGSYFSYTFKREFEDAPEQGDNKLGHAFEDSIVATFRNSDLPLDTLRYAIPFRISGTIGLKNGYYYDNDADGYVDSIFLEYKGETTKEQGKELLDFVTLPSHRGFELINTEVYDDGIGLTVRQKDIESDDKMVTYVTKEDVLNIKEGFLQSGGWVVAETVEIIDKVAPIIMKADIVCYEDPDKDNILTVTFSEPVFKVTKHSPFYFWSSNPEGLLYTANLRLQSSNETKMVFVVQLIKGITESVNMVHKKDSIWIFWDDKQVGDKLSNFQDNKNNRRRLLDVDQRYTAFNLIPKGINPYNRNKPENHEIPAHILDILPKDNADEIANSADPNTGMLLRVVPQIPKSIDLTAIPDYSLKGTVTIYDPAGNTVVENRTMGYQEKSKTLNFVWNGLNTSSRNCGKGAYLALFKVAQLRGSDEINIGETSIKLLVVLQ